MTTYQHKAVKEIAIVQDAGGKVWLKANKTRSRFTVVRWVENTCDFQKEFESVEAAMEAALKCCPIFTGSDGVQRASIQRARWVYGIGYCGV